MQDIAFKDWRLTASAVDTDILKLDVEATDGSDILEVSEGGPGATSSGDQYALLFTTQRIEQMHDRTPRRGAARERGDAENDLDEGGSDWLADEDETVYIRGWETTAFVDEEGMLHVTVERNDNSEIYQVEPIEAGVPLAPRVVVRLGAEEVEDEDEEKEEEDLEEDYEDLEDYDELAEVDEFDEDFGNDLEEDEDLDLEDVLNRDEDLY